MGQVPHGNAATTHAIRAVIQRSKTSNASPGRDLGITVETVAKWRKRHHVEDAAMGPKEARSTVLGIEEAVIVAFRRHTLLPPDDCLEALQPTIPHLTRSSLHRCLQRHGINRLPRIGCDKPKGKFKRHPIGHVHMDIAAVRTGEGKIRLFVAVERTSTFAHVALHERAGKMVAAQFPAQSDRRRGLHHPHTILTDDGMQFTNRKQDRLAMEPIFSRACRKQGIDRRRTRVNHPWTNGPVERMNTTIKEATIKRHHGDTQSRLEAHVMDFIAACNCARRLKTLQGLTPFEYICKIWTSEPKRSNIIPTHHTPRLNN